MKYNHQYAITLKHLLIENQKQIGLKFYPNKVIQALIKELPNPKWSNEFGMVYILNNKSNLDKIFEKFRAVAWVNCSHFFINRPIDIENVPIDVNWFRKRTVDKNYRC